MTARPSPHLITSLAVVIDKVLVHKGFTTLHVLATGMVALALFDALLGGLRTYLFAHTTNRIDVGLGAQLFRHILALPLAYFEARRVGDTVARVRELEHIRQFLTSNSITVVLDLVFTVVLDLVFTVVFLVVMWFYSPLLTMVVVGSLPLYALLSVVITPLVRVRLNEKFNRGAENQSFLVEAISGIQTVKALAVEPPLQRRWDEQLAEYVRTSFRATSLITVASQIASFIQKAGREGVRNHLSERPTGRSAHMVPDPLLDLCCGIPSRCPGDSRGAANVEHLSLADNFTAVGPYANNATGNALDNLIIGNTRDNVLDGGAGNDVLVGGLFRAYEVGFSETGSDLLIGGAGDDVLMADGGNVAFSSIAGFEGGESRDDVVRQADDLFIGGLGNDTYILHSQQQTVAEFANEGTDTVEAHVSYALGENIENLTLVGAGSLSGTGNGLDNVLIGNEEGNVLDGREGNDTLWGGSALNFDSGVVPSGNDMVAVGLGDDYLVGGTGNDQYTFLRGDGADTISEDDAAVGNNDRLLFGNSINPLDLVVSRQANNLRLAIHGTSEQVVIENWYLGDTHHLENVQAGNGQTLLNTQVDQLIQAMAGFSQQTGLTSDQALDQRPQDVQTVLAASWQ